jgi:hypothetical protein
MAERRTLTIVAAVASLAILLALAAVLTQSSHHRTDTNGFERAIGAKLPPRAITCQPNEQIPAGTGRVGFYADSLGAHDGPLEVTVSTASGATLARAPVSARVFDPGARTTAAIPAMRHAVEGAHVCITNTGRGSPAVYGSPAPSPDGAATAPTGVPQTARWLRLHLDYQQPEESSWWSFAPTVARRFGLVKATFFGTWTLWATVVALLALCLGSVWYTARALSR